MAAVVATAGENGAGAVSTGAVEVASAPPAAVVEVDSWFTSAKKLQAAEDLLRPYLNDPSQKDAALVAALEKAQAQLELNACQIHDTERWLRAAGSLPQGDKHQVGEYRYVYIFTKPPQPSGKPKALTRCHVLCPSASRPSAQMHIARSAYCIQELDAGISKVVDAYDALSPPEEEAAPPPAAVVKMEEGSDGATAPDAGSIMETDSSQEATPAPSASQAPPQPAEGVSDGAPAPSATPAPEIAATAESLDGNGAGMDTS